MKRIAKFLSIFLVLSMIIAPMSLAETDLEEVETITSEIAVIVFDEDGEYDVELEPMEVVLEKDEEALMVLDQLDEAVDGEYEGTESEYGLFLTSILGKEATENASWMFYVNDEEAKLGVSNLELNEGDQVLFYYTPDWENELEVPTWAELLAEDVEDAEDEEDEIDYDDKFTDLAGYKWAEDSIEDMAEKGIIKGVSENKFNPGASIKRGDFVTLISRMLDYDEDAVEELPFDDVDPEKYYYKAVGAAYENNLVGGKTDTMFDPEGFMTREEMAKVLGSILENKDYEKQGEEVLAKLTDSKDISAWAMDGAAILVHNEIIVGSDGKFLPKDNVKRAEVAVMLDRLYELIMD